MVSKSKENQLIKACKRNDYKTVQSLINSTFKSHPRHKYLRSSQDANKMTHTSNVQHLNVNCRESRFQMTPLMIASLRGSRDIVLALLQAGASPTIKDVKGNTALQLACMKQRFHVIDALLQNKANPNDVNLVGWNCLISAVNYFHEDSAIMLLLLLQTGAKIDHKDNSGLNCIDHAVKKNKITQYCVRALVNAVIKGCFDIVLMLLNYGVNPNKVDIITGTGPLHEAVRYNDIKDEKNRQERIKIVRFLALYGADPELVNVKRETPMQLALEKPGPISDQYIKALKEFYKLPHLSPKFVKISSIVQNELSHLCNYPLLTPLANWTRNEQKFCSSFNSYKGELVTNLIDGDPTTMWCANGQNLNWVIFDMKADHVVNKLRIYSWKSNEMPNEMFLQVSNSLEGPWSCVQSFRCDMIGSVMRNSPGVPVEVSGFNACSRFWRLVVANNHGAAVTSFHGVEFFGYDNRISRLIEQLKLSEYEQPLIENNLNQIDALMNCTYDKFASLPIPDAHDKETLWHFILEFQKKVQPLMKLEWFNEPVPFGLVGQKLPAFSVTSTAFLTNTLHLISHGGGVLEGETYIDMESGGMNDPSMAIFRNISFANPGKFVIEVRSVRNNSISISSQQVQIFEAGDPEYERLLKLYPKFSHNESLQTKKLRRQEISSEVDSDDDTLDQIYGFPDFTEHTSKMKINKWLSKSQDDEDEIDETIPVCVQQEFETQSMTMEFNDDLVSLRSFSYNDSKFLPKSEARVFVNNPELFEYPNTKQLTQIVTPRDNFTPRQTTSRDMQPDYNDSTTEEYDLPSPVNLSITLNNTLNSPSPRQSPRARAPLPPPLQLGDLSPGASFRSPAPVPPPPPPPAPMSTVDTSPKPSFSGPVPPPPPPPPFLLNLNQPKDGLLKFQKTKETTSQPLKPKQAQTTPVNELQRELELKLVNVRKNLDRDAEGSTNNERQSRKYSAIHHFDPEYISSPKEVNFKNMSGNNLEEFSNKENASKSKNLKNGLDFNPRETFTSKAKKALEEYKIEKSTSYSSLSGHSASSSVDLRSVAQSHNKKHAPLPFKFNQSLLK